MHALCHSEISPNRARLVSMRPCLLSLAPDILLPHPAAEVHHRCRLYTSPHGWTLTVDPTDLMASLLHHFNSATCPLLPLLAFFVETDNLLPHTAIKLPSEARVVLLPHDRLGVKLCAVDDIKLEQLLHAQHVHSASRGSLGVPSMVPVEGRMVGVDVANGGLLRGSMVPADGGALAGSWSQPSSAQGARGRQTAAAVLP
jgi:hypothetical protein